VSEWRANGKQQLIERSRSVSLPDVCYLSLEIFPNAQHQEIDCQTEAMSPDRIKTKRLFIQNILPSNLREMREL